eukprot:jgi/Mesen1/1986/ME000147S01078
MLKACTHFCKPLKWMPVGYRQTLLMAFQTCQLAVRGLSAQACIGPAALVRPLGALSAAGLTIRTCRVSRFLSGPSLHSFMGSSLKLQTSEQLRQLGMRACSEARTAAARDSRNDGSPANRLASDVGQVELKPSFSSEDPTQDFDFGGSDEGALEAEAVESVAAQTKETQPRFTYPKKGQELELVCESLAFKGLGVCKVVGTGFVVLCERALPGERLIARINRKKGSFAQAYKVATLTPHADAVEPPCEHFPACGGCKLQNLAYAGQLAAKQQQVADLVSRLGRFGESAEGARSGAYLRPIVPCSKEYHYRNKMEFSFGSRIWLPTEEHTLAPRQPPASRPPPPSPSPSPSSSSPSNSPSSSPPAAKEARRGRAKHVEPNPKQFALGLHAPRRFDKILPIRTCLLQHEVANQVLATVREFCEARHTGDLPCYDPVTHEGFLRHVTIRTGSDPESGGLQLMVNIMTKESRPALLQPLADLLVESYPAVVSVVNTVNASRGNEEVGVSEHVLHGTRTITDTLRGLHFEISANSFFQTNTGQAEELYRLTEEACELRADGSQVLLDLFCGTGTIGLSMASKVKHVYGYELVPAAVADARRNATRNGIANATFVEGDLNRLTDDFGSGFPRPDVIVTDPNRPGMHPKLLKFLAESGTPRIVYVSCNPGTCARDLDYLCHGPDNKGGPYRLVSIQPVDMFPHTPHVECVSVLQLREDWQPHASAGTP